MVPKRPHDVHILFSDEEIKRLDALVKEDSRDTAANRSGVIRRLIREEHVRRLNLRKRAN